MIIANVRTGNSGNSGNSGISGNNYNSDYNYSNGNTDTTSNNNNYVDDNDNNNNIITSIIIVMLTVIIICQVITIKLRLSVYESLNNLTSFLQLPITKMWIISVFNAMEILWLLINGFKLFKHETTL